jgi:hypothetical protein
VSEENASGQALIKNLIFFVSRLSVRCQVKAFDSEKNTFGQFGTGSSAG